MAKRCHPEMRQLPPRLRSLLLHMHMTGQRVVLSLHPTKRSLYCLDRDMTSVTARSVNALMARKLISEPGLLIIPSSGGGLTEEGQATIRRMRKKDQPF